MATLPCEIIVDEILPRLPAKSLVRFKCVSKEFHALIKSKEFTNLHLHYSIASDANCILVANIYEEGNDDNSALHIVDLDSTENPPALLRLPDDFEPSNSNPLVGTCNGLLLIRSSDNHYSLINPSTGFYTPVDNNWPGESNGNFLMYGFGYDALADVYKIVGINHVQDQDSHVVARSETIMSIKFITAQLSGFEKISIRHEGVIVDSHLCHWLVWSSSRGKHRIVCFDLCSESWTSDVPLPDDHSVSCSDSGSQPHFADLLFDFGRDKEHDVVDFGVLDGCLCVLMRNVDHTNHRDVWVMKEYGVKESWIKVLPSPFHDIVTCSLRFTPLARGRGSSSSKILVRKGGRNKLNGRTKFDSQFVWYDKRLRSAQTLDFKKRKIHVGDACVYKGSLVTVPGGKNIRELLTRERS